ncbi:carbohydrate porin [Gluconacetobacter azotocaptans]|uniref:carbohydrate porin n=1 Tax=Gluconacetobacter azotocaptans TaxID=142834 RepID=UPI00222EAFF2|nr:carbohydrate porin [Gluconacetobacter azotocaptans]
MSISSLLSRIGKRKTSLVVASLFLFLCQNPGVAAPSSPYTGLSSPSGPSSFLDSPASYDNTPFTPNTEHAFGTWNGLLPALAKKGIGLGVDYVGESGIILNGGRTDVTGSAGYAHQVAVQVNLNWQKLIGWKGFMTHTAFVNRAGHNLSTDAGDRSVTNVQEIYGGGGNVVVHLVYTYGTQDFMNQRMQLAFGYMPVNIDFSTSPLYCTFMNNSMCGNPKTETKGSAGYSNTPNAVYAARLRVWPLHGLYLQSGVYGVNRGIGQPKYTRTGFEFNTNTYTGVYIPFEIGLIPVFGPHALIGHYKMAAAYDSSPYPYYYEDIHGNPLPLTGLPARTGRGKIQVWATMDQMIFRHGRGLYDGLYLMAGYVHNTPHNSPYEHQYYLGLSDRGMIPGRPGDVFGVVVNHVVASSALVATQKLYYQRGKSLPANALSPQSSATVVEGTYNFHVYQGVWIQPDFQYIINPNLEKKVKNLSVFGLRLRVIF